MRLTIPPRRASTVQAMDFDGQHFSIGWSCDGDGLPIEVFIQTVKRSSQMEDACREIAVLISLALQHGVTLDVLRKAITRRENGAAAGVGGAVLDMIAQDLPGCA